jgi:hypothetical protein
MPLEPYLPVTYEILLIAASSIGGNRINIIIGKVP